MNRELHKIDATGQTVGRLATRTAILLRGKDRPEYRPNLDEGAVVEVFNIAKLRFTGKKMEQKAYYSYSGYPGGLKTRKMKDVFSKDPGEVLRRAVREMLPANRLRPKMMRRLVIK